MCVCTQCRLFIICVIRVHEFENEETKATTNACGVLASEIARLHTQQQRRRRRRRWWCVFVVKIVWNNEMQAKNHATSVCWCVLHSLFISVFVHIYLLMCLCVCVWCCVELSWAVEWTRINGKKFKITTKHSLKMLETFTIVSRKKVFLCSNSNSISTNHRKPVLWMLTHTHAKQDRKKSNKTHWKTACSANWRTHTSV